MKKLKTKEIKVMKNNISKKLLKIEVVVNLKIELNFEEIFFYKK